MFKKIILCVVAAVLLIGAENAIAGRRKAGPEARPKQNKLLQGKQRQTPCGCGEAVANRHKLMAAAAAHRGMQAPAGKQRAIGPRQIRAGAQMFGRWLDEITKAYRENDREKMGQLLRRMHQIRQRWQGAGAAISQRQRYMAPHGRAGRIGAGLGRAGMMRRKVGPCKCCGFCGPRPLALGKPGFGGPAEDVARRRPEPAGDRGGRAPWRPPSSRCCGLPRDVERPAHVRAPEPEERLHWTRPCEEQPRPMHPIRPEDTERPRRQRTRCR